MANEILEKCNLPRDRATFNAWFRSFAALNPVVSLAIEFYTSVLLNNLVVSSDFPKRVRDVYQQILELINLEALLNEYWIVG